MRLLRHVRLLRRIRHGLLKNTTDDVMERRNLQITDLGFKGLEHRYIINIDTNNGHHGNELWNRQNIATVFDVISALCAQKIIRKNLKKIS